MRKTVVIVFQILYTTSKTIYKRNLIQQHLKDLNYKKMFKYFMQVKNLFIIKNNKSSYIKRYV